MLGFLSGLAPGLLWEWLSSLPTAPKSPHIGDYRNGARKLSGKAVNWGNSHFLFSHPSLLNACEAGQQTQEHGHLMRPQNGLGGHRVFSIKIRGSALKHWVYKVLWVVPSWHLHTENAARTYHLHGLCAHDPSRRLPWQKRHVGICKCPPESLHFELVFCFLPTLEWWEAFVLGGLMALRTHTLYLQSLAVGCKGDQGIITIWSLKIL